MTAGLDLRRDGRVLEIWLTRPEKRNALNLATLEEIARVFEGLATEFGVRAAVLAGRGPSFCAGVDRSEVPGSSRDTEPTERERRYMSQLGARVIRAIRDCEVPTLARVQGHAIGGGALIAVACDFRIVADDAVFAIPEIDLGLPLTWAGTPRLISEIGAARAREMIMFGDRVAADEAMRYGLAHVAVPPDDLDGVVREWANRLAEKPELAMHMTKTQFRAFETAARIGDVTETDGDLLSGSFGSADARERFRHT